MFDCRFADHAPAGSAYEQAFLDRLQREIPPNPTNEECGSIYVLAKSQVDGSKHLVFVDME